MDQKNRSMKRVALRSYKRRYTYMVTIHRSQVLEYVSPDELIDALNIVVSKTCGSVSDVVFEVGQRYRQLHMHLILKTNFRIKFKKYSQVGLFKIYWKPVYDIEGVREYLHKDAHNGYMQDQILDTNYYQNNYGFE